MRVDLIKFIRNLVEIDFEHQVANSRHFKIMLVIITVNLKIIQIVSYLIARAYENIMICVNSIFIGTLFCFVLFGLAMPWSRRNLQFKPISNLNNNEQEQGIAGQTELSMVVEE